MEKFGVHKDLASYKKVLNVFPKGKYVAENRLQADFFHYPKHQDCANKIMGKFQGGFGQACSMCNIVKET